MHMHLVKTAYHKEYAFKRIGTTFVKHLEELGLLGEQMTLGLGIWMTQEDIEICAGTNTCICHNCSSIYMLLFRLLSLMELLKRGVVRAWVWMRRALTKIVICRRKCVWLYTSTMCSARTLKRYQQRRRR